MAKAVTKAVFPVAGLGTRFLPATKSMPKEMLTIVDRPLIQYVVEEAKAAGIEEFIFVTGRGKSALEDHFDHAYELEDTLGRRGKDEILKSLQDDLSEAGNVVYTRQQAPLGLGHAVWCARHFIQNEPFAVLLPDELVLSETPCLKQMVDAHKKVGGNLIATMEVPKESTNKYGILETGDDDGTLIQVTGLVEKPSPADAPSNLSITGRYILQPEIFDHLGKKQKGAGDEIQLTDAMAQMIGQAPFHGYRFEGDRHDCGHALGFIQANLAFGLRRSDYAEDLKVFIKTLQN